MGTLVSLIDILLHHCCSTSLHGPSSYHVHKVCGTKSHDDHMSSRRTKTSLHVPSPMTNFAMLTKPLDFRRVPDTLTRRTSTYTQLSQQLQPSKMGSGNSKPAPQSSQHIFARYALVSLPPTPHQLALHQHRANPSTSTPSETPVRFSQELVDSLQASTEVGVTVSHLPPSPFQSFPITRIIPFQTDTTRQKTLELHIQARVAEELKRIEAHESALLREAEEKLSSEPLSTGPTALQGRDGQAAEEKQRELGRESIQREIASLKTKLDGRKKLEELDRGVEKAKSEVVQCLRANDRRPLDCWREVEAFRREVARLERTFVDRTLR